MDKLAIRKKKKIYPWLFVWYDINKRCNNSKSDNYKYYGGKGVKNYLTQEELKKLWFRDKAYKMDRPSIDRIDSNGNYEINNCRFIEMNKNISRACSIAILQYDLDGNFIKEWRSATKAAQNFHGTEANIRRVLYGKSYTAFGYQWKYKNQDKIILKIAKAKKHEHLPTNSKPIIQLDLNDNIIAYYSSAKEAHRKTLIDYSSICDSANHFTHTAGGYKWRYKS